MLSPNKSILLIFLKIINYMITEYHKIFILVNYCIKGGNIDEKSL
jgi:hypothetical protein